MFSANRAFLFLASATYSHAASFTSWPDDICRSVATHDNRMLEPYDCFKLDSPVAAGSVKGSGLQGTSAAGGDRIELYADQNCGYYVSSVKHNDHCMIVQYRSLRYLPPLPTNETDATELVMTEDDLARAAERRQEDDELEAALLRVRQEGELTVSADSNRFAPSQSKQDL